MIRRGIAVALFPLLLACAPKPPLEELPPLPFEVMERQATMRYLNDQFELPPAPIRPDDAVQTPSQAIALARKECPLFWRSETASLHNEFWLVRFGELQSVFIYKKDGSAYNCEEIIED